MSKPYHHAVIIGLFAFLVVSGTAWGYAPSCVVVNGHRLSVEEARAIGQIHGVPLACGYYWFDPRTGLWGQEGGPALGRLGDGSRINPGGGGYHYSGPGGYSGSDGDTSYYFDPGTGCSVIPGEGVSC